MRTARTWGSVTLAAVLGLAACGGGRKAGAPLGDAAIQGADVVARAGAFQQPLDAAPSPDGSSIYFVAAHGPTPAVFLAPAAGGSPFTLAEGAPLTKPTGIAVASDGRRFYVADQQTRQPGGTGTAGGPGAILTAPTAGAPNTPTVLPGTEGRSPRGLDVVNQGDADLVYFTGTDPANGAPALFQVSAAGGTVLTVAEGAPLISPDSVVVSAEGVVYVTDQGGGPGQGKVFRVSGGTVNPILTGLRLGAPAGLTLARNDSVLLVSSIDAATSSDQVLFLDLATGKTAAATRVIGANKNSSGGLHRAHNANVLGWADVSSRVYRVRLGGPATS